MRNAPGQHLLVVGLNVLVPVCAAQPPDDAPRPVYRTERYDEDWSSLKDPSKRRDPFDRLKYTGLGRENWYFTLAGEARLRYEIVDQPGFGRGPQDSNGYILQRYLFSGDFHLGPHLRFFVELQSALSNGRNGGPRFTDLNRLDAGQAFADVSTPPGGNSRWTLRLGRQEVGFGTGRLISPAEGLNVRRAFDGVRLIYQRRAWTFNAVTLKLTGVRPGIFDDVPEHRQTFWGAGAIGPHPLWNKASLSFYYLGLDKTNTAFLSGTGRQIRHTAGTRSFKTAGPWDFNYEAILQWGSFAGLSIRSWAFASDTGFTFTSSRRRPRIGLRSDIASGDRSAADRRLNTFDPLFASAIAYSGSAGLIGPVNLIDVTPSIRFLLRRNLTFGADAPFYWRHRLNDGIYSVFVTPLRPGLENPQRFVGTAPSISSTWQANLHTSLTASYSRFFTGRFFDQSPPGRNTTYFGLTTAFRF